MCRNELAARKDILEHGKIASSPTTESTTGAMRNVESEEPPAEPKIATEAGTASSQLSLTSIPSANLSHQITLVGRIRTAQASSSPILTAQCSGYFVQPLPWMQPITDRGEPSGKITCPNKKCGAKLGNFNWAGMKCSCKEWVTPGFCLNRSKVDEIWS